MDNNQEIQKPTAGRTVHYFTNEDVAAGANNAEIVPAVVVQSFGGLTANLVLFTMNTEQPVMQRFSVLHKSEANTEGVPYWDWPEIKK